MSKAKHYCFTVFNCDADTLETHLLSKHWVHAFAFQEELAPETNRHHLQGHLICLPKQKWLTVTNWIRGACNGAGVDCSVSRDPYASIRYCLDPDKRIQGTRERILNQAVLDAVQPSGRQATPFKSAASDLALGKRTLRQIYNDDPGLVGQHLRAFKAIQMFPAMEPQDRLEPGELKVIVHWGATGTGKTRSVWETHPAMQVYVPLVQGSNVWFDGYVGQPVLLLDDFDPECLSLPFLLKLTDLYPMQLAVKGTSCWKHWKTVYITSNLPPQDWYPSAVEEHQKALRRRLTQVVHYRGGLTTTTTRTGSPFRSRSEPLDVIDLTEE